MESNRDIPRILALALVVLSAATLVGAQDSAPGMFVTTGPDWIDLAFVNHVDMNMPESDGKTYRADPGPFGLGAHIPLFVMLPPREGIR